MKNKKSNHKKLNSQYNLKEEDMCPLTLDKKIIKATPQLDTFDSLNKLRMLAMKRKHNKNLRHFPSQSDIDIANDNAYDLQKEQCKTIK